MKWALVMNRSRMTSRSSYSLTCPVSEWIYEEAAGTTDAVGL